MPALQRHVGPEAVVLYRSAQLLSEGFAHGFSTRHGGVSAAPFDTMNLGVAQAPGQPDSDENIAENARRLMKAIGAPEAAMVRVRQVHGSQVYACAGDERFGPPEAEADGVIAASARTAACVRTADCVPVLLACTATGAVAAVHAGWRGIVAGVVSQTIAQMRARHGSRSAGILAAIGPCIGAGVYEVGAETAAEFERAGLGEFVLAAGAGGRAKEHLDCFGAVREQLLLAGIPLDSVDGQELCTVGTPREFFSYRRDGARSGRMAAVIVPRTRAPGHGAA